MNTQANGCHERLHRTLKQEVAAEDRRAQQRELGRFRQEYNQVRPHEALGMQTPASVYEPSAREYPARVPEPEYPSTMLVRSVKSQVVFRWKKHDVFLSEVLWSERIGLLPRDERWFTIYFAQLPLAEFDSAQLRIGALLLNTLSTLGRPYVRNQEFGVQYHRDHVGRLMLFPAVSLAATEAHASVDVPASAITSGRS